MKNIYIYIHIYIHPSCKCKLYCQTSAISPSPARQAEGFCTKFCTANSDEHSAPVAAGGRCLGDSNAPVLQDTFI